MADLTPDDYARKLAEAKAAIQSARTRATLAINAELIDLYWRLGRMILDMQATEGPRTGVVARLSTDLRFSFPAMTGLGRSNLNYMRAFAAAWPDWPSFQRVVGKIPWGHNLELLDGLKDTDERLWYAEKAYEHGWARSVLAHHIDTKLHLRQGAATTNFSHALPSPDSDLAQQLLKDPYHFEFLGITDEAAEREIESALMTHVQRFLLELGRGFAFVGRQYLLAVGGEDFFIDLLFFHIPTKRYVVIELKRTGFAPEAIGKLNFYVNVIDDQLCNDGDNRTIGLLLCKDRNEVVVRYALSGFSTPLAVAGYRLADLPPEAQAALPQEAGLIEAVDAAVDAFEQEHGED